MEKEDYDLHIELMVKNLINDQASYNINYREAFHNMRDTNDYLREEVEEVEAAVVDLRDDNNELWKRIKADDPLEEQLFRLECIERASIEVIIEALHVAAVARKGLIQLDKEKAPVGGNPN